jgi:hypothetical protein
VHFFDSMRTVLLVVIEIISGLNVLAQEKIFKYPRDHSELKLIVVNSKMVDLNLDSAGFEFSTAFHIDSANNFRIDDKRAIENFSNGWRGKRAVKVFLCWYDFFVYVQKGNEIVDVIQINTECKQARTGHGTFDFTSNPFEWLTKGSTVSTLDVRCRDKEEMSKIIQQCKRERPNYLIVDGDWEIWQTKIDENGSNTSIRIIGDNYNYLEALRRKYTH